MRRRPPVEPLDVCRACAGRLVHPYDWHAAGQDRWWVALRCPDCGAIREGTFDQRTVEAFDDALDEAWSVMLGALRRLTHANMADELELFAAALEADAILPEDF